MIKNQHYVYRMTVLMASVVSQDVLLNSMLPVSAAKDKVPNVKFNVAKMLQRVTPLLDRAIIDHTIKPCLAELCDDTDMDVRFYARQALLAADGQAA